MREFEDTFREGLKVGLRKHHSNPRNKEGLVECLNVRPSKRGVKPIVAITTPMTVAMAWPFPQVHEVSVP